jgi:hypothetical protein
MGFWTASGSTHGRLTGLHLIVAINIVAGLGIFFSGYGFQLRSPLLPF